MIERGVVLARGNEIGPEALPPELQSGAPAPSAVALPEGVGLSEAVSRYERQLIEAALRKSGGGFRKRPPRCWVSSPPPLNEKIKRLGIRP